MSSTRIIIAGIGGVGGYFGGLLAHHYAQHPGAEIEFIARGKNLEAIRAHGLKVIQGSQEFVARPALATANPADAGPADFILLCTKGYDLEGMLEQLRPCIQRDTILLPLLNGVDSREWLRQTLPHNLVLDSCVYVVSRLLQPGVVENTGKIDKIYFGPEDRETDRLKQLERIFREAGIDALLTPDIAPVMWEKFIFIAAVATATSWFNKTIAELLTDESSLHHTLALIEEVKQVAKARGIKVAENMTELTLNKIKAIAPGTTSSMHSDYRQKKHQTELESLTGFVVREGRKFHVPTPTFDTAYQLLNKKRVT